MKHGLLGVALGVGTMAEALAELPRLAAVADIVELRLDHFGGTYDLSRLLRDRSVPVIATNRPIREGGRSADDDATRLAVLRQAAELGAEYVDVEWDATSPEILAELRAAGARVIISRHSFTEMPGELSTWASRAAEAGADVVKVVGMARDARDALAVLRILARTDLPTIAIAMGEAGLPSRILAPRYDSCFLTFCSPGSVDPTAPGQLTVAEMRSVYRVDRLRQTTRIYGLLSPWVERDLAEQLNRWFVERHADAIAVPFPTLDRASDVVLAFRELPVAGWLVEGADLQRDVVAAVDELRPGAAGASKVNRIVAGDRGLVGDWVEAALAPSDGWFDDDGGRQNPTVS